MLSFKIRGPKIQKHLNKRTKSVFKTMYKYLEEHKFTLIIFLIVRVIAEIYNLLRN
jgi:hypothetical protein